MEIKMITLTFETWEEFDNAISGITSLTISLNEKEDSSQNAFDEMFSESVDALANLSIIK
jgi:hypothetical protein